MRKIIISNLISYVIWATAVMAGFIGYTLLSDKESK